MKEPPANIHMATLPN